MVKRKGRGLGRGLSSIIPEALKETSIEEIVKDSGTLESIDIDKIVAREDQPRKHFDAKLLEDLKKSIIEHGVLQPILVRKFKNKYEIIAGERRYRASKLAKKENIPAIVLDVDDLVVSQISLIENIQREDLNPVEEAVAYEKILDEFSWTQEELGKKLGKSRAVISNTLRLLKLEEKYLDALKNNLITSSQGRTLLSLNEKDRELYFKKLINKTTTVREMEKTANKNHDYQKANEEKLSKYLDRKINFVPKKKGGKIEISYVDNDDLEKLMEMLLKKAE